ncbi:class III extradiol ring-cleavage dioxygenase [Umezawaea sp. Da 62-37]|uniref:dioxygenase family protein n=1 Tax=Umezawaea sp. Da 62-37 TaxID=3075927 RepID=UPI0028F6C542|nr:class III extradiol ring-cleavage dioxygenase [Umezawaea sp. Da 62-37]WNV91970.1 class III extradiol ring-cleavage dioxygenase [Umezawaea sp. Da 62-37]
MPVLYLSHGAPPLADDKRWTEELASWSANLPRPKSILMISAHWEESPLTLGATRTVPLTYDFGGFPQRYYEVEYRAPGAPELADDVRKLISDTDRVEQEDRGLDHGAYVPLKEMFPAADIPVLQMSMPSLDPRQLFDLGRRLAPLRDQDMLIVGSGFMTHNLRGINMSLGTTATPPTWSSEFDDWASRTLAAGDVDSMLDFQRKAPAAGIAHPRTEHFAPLFVSLGASLDQSAPRTAVDGFWYGLSKRSVQFG